MATHAASPSANYPPPAGYNPQPQQQQPQQQGGAYPQPVAYQPQYGQQVQARHGMYEDESDPLIMQREAVTRENTMRGMTSQPAWILVIFFGVSALCFAATIGSDEWFKAKSDTNPVSNYGLFKFCNGDDCSDWDDICDGDKGSAVCSNINAARDRAFSAIFSAFIGLLLTTWNLLISRRNPEAHPLRRMIVLGALVSGVASSAGDALRLSAMTLENTELPNGDRVYELDGAWGGWAFGFVNTLVLGSVMLVLWCQCGRLRCKPCCFALRTPVHLLAMPLAMQQPQQMQQVQVQQPPAH